MNLINGKRVRLSATFIGPVSSQNMTEFYWPSYSPPMCFSYTKLTCFYWYAIFQALPFFTISLHFLSSLSNKNDSSGQRSQPFFTSCLHFQNWIRRLSNASSASELLVFSSTYFQRVSYFRLVFRVCPWLRNFSPLFLTLASSGEI